MKRLWRRVQTGMGPAYELRATGHLIARDASNPKVWDVFAAPGEDQTPVEEAFTTLREAKAELLYELGITDTESPKQDEEISQ